MKLRVLLLTRYPHLGASSRIRFLQYVPGLRAFGIEVEATPFWDETYLRRLYAGQGRRWSSLLAAWKRRLGALRRAKRYDVLWIEKEILPWWPAGLGGMAASLPIVLDLDDAWHLRYENMRSPLGRSLLRHRLEQLVRRATVVTAANPFLQGWAKATGAATVVNVPSTVDLDRYQVATLDPDAPFTLGWIGTPETVHYLADITDALRQVLSKPNTRLLIIGGGHFSLPGARVELHDWSYETEISLLQQINVGLMPLRGGNWESGKSAYKLIQYMAVGRPVVASPIGTSKLLVKPGVNGFLAASEADWVASIERLRANRELAAELGHNARRHMEESYSMQTQLPRIAEVLIEAAGRASA